MLSCFGTRLRARHGAGTKRHIKFDDFSGLLFANIKLPGDETWTKVTATTARDDLEVSLREENANAQKRLATKLIPGPKERLSRPSQDVRSTRPLGAAPPSGVAATMPSQGWPSGKRPKWSVPERRRPI